MKANSTSEESQVTDTGYKVFVPRAIHLSKDLGGSSTSVIGGTDGFVSA